MKPANNPDLAVAQEWFARLKVWLRDQDLREALSKRHKTAAPGMGYLRFVMFSGKAPAAEAHRSALCVLQAHLAEGNLLMQAVTGEDEYREAAATHIAALLEFVQSELPSSNTRQFTHNDCTSEAVVLLPVWQALIAGAREDSAQGRACMEAMGQINDHLLGHTEPDYGKAHPLIALQIAACLATTATLHGLEEERRADTAQLVAEYIPANADILFKARNRTAPIYLHRELMALDALHAVATAFPELVSQDTMRTEIRTLLDQLPKSGVPVLKGVKGPVMLRDAVETVLVFSRLGGCYTALRNKAIQPLRWSSFYLQDTTTGAPYAYRFRLRSAVNPAPIFDCTRLYLALAAYLHFHDAPLSASLGNAYEG